MRAPQPLAAPKAQDMASLLIPLEGQFLLVPNVSVAEIVPLGRVEQVTGGPEWFLGNYQWRDLSVPLLSFEAINGAPRATAGSRARVAVFNSTGVSDDLPFVAILAQGLPRLARVSADELQEREDVEKKPFDLMPVSWAGEQAVIPDVGALEQAVLDVLKGQN
ncbi:chemotaxis protein CheW [Marinimicrobium sp. ABcell2]|uniref:chemotaxis protein CheW n=1 Tax=Marinimicrobium sp. ABcell2 TaxID=3069751 RepID=UPI0027B362F7|nr:chemotaxis protein CheW [Marinimicrobium sp. ABcell2]MDQ2076570.1 chemotaxis protein CheW [Marinimicrobium sp. ABcell2]